MKVPLYLIWEILGEPVAPLVPPALSLNKINKDFNWICGLKNFILKELSYEQSLDYLSLSIQNRLKVESAASEEKQQKLSPLKNNLFEQLSKFESVIDEITIKVEE